MIDKTKTSVSKLPPLGALPKWDLSDIYTSTVDPSIEKDLCAAGESVSAFVSRYKGELKELNKKELFEAIEEFERLHQQLYLVLSYAQLSISVNNRNEKLIKFLQDVSERITEITLPTLFFELEISSFEKIHHEELLEASELELYKPWLKFLRFRQQHQLPIMLEQFLKEKAIIGREAWGRLFDETIAELRFKWGAAEVNCEELLSLMTDRNPDNRKEAAIKFSGKLAENINIFTLIINTLAKDKEIEDRLRGFARPISQRNLENQVEDETIDALVETVEDNFQNISHRYYTLKAKWMDVEFLNYWDRNAPLPGLKNDFVTWDGAKQIILEAFYRFDSRMGETAKLFFENDWVDASPRSSKDHGAFCHQTVPSSHPYILLNYRGRLADVMTLAHELGHGIHHVLAGSKGFLLSHIPITLAETASVFSEMLVFESLLKKIDQPSLKKNVLASKIESTINTLIRQIAFHQFEERVHLARRKGELSTEQISTIWMSVQKKSLGPIFKFDENYQNFWAYIPHFVHTPFYVYSYAFAFCSASSLYGIYNEGASDFATKYFEMLRAGGSSTSEEHLQQFGLDIRRDSFWQQGLDAINNYINELEKLL